MSKAHIRIERELLVMLRKISVALVAAAVTALIAGNSASAKDVGEVEHAKPIESHKLPPRHLLPATAPLDEHPSAVRDYPVGTSTNQSTKGPPKQPGPGGPVPTTGNGGGGFTDLPGAPVVCLGAEWRCKESVN
jgi:hypothetical protein